ncbi:MAG: DEAD/DEAH box helicase, partial [Bacteroidota bacterium]
IDFLKKAHPEFELEEEAEIQAYFYLPVREMINNYWFVHFNEACEAADIAVLGQKNLSKFKYSKHRAQTHIHIKSGIDWFDVEASVSFGTEQVKMSDWIRALRNKENFVKLKDGSLGILPEEWLKQAAKVIAVADVEKGQLKISKYRFNVIEDLFEDLDDQKILEELNEKKRRLQMVDTNKKYELPKNVTATLRDYQKHGFEWLMFLNESGFGGILADDMGLGKTLQVITLLADQIDNEPSLVIVPRSLLFNWGAELDKFCPDLKYVIHHGPNRDKDLKAILPTDIIITTYTTAALDIQVFKDFRFNYIVLDESQAIKNPDSKRYKAMRLLQSNNKIAMTGTPIENNTFDLYAQLSFTSPGLLGSMTSFKNNFSIPIDSQGDIEAANLLRKLIFPFILRRTKEQVAKDLPEKIETIIYCEMDRAQRKLYDNLKRQIKEDIESEVEEKGVNKSKFKILDGLLRLRQMCNSPLLINKSFTGANANSVKINTLMENLTEALDQKHNALVFSQFTSLLAIIREELDKRGIRYAYLDGSTTKRQAQVDKFMNNSEIRIFLISIKAGNTGMNLVKADYVYIVDPWWNPAVEAQAIDRTHRIGQQNKIFAYKLICKNTIEEKILKLQAKKKKLASDIIQTDENVLKSLDKEELIALFD